MARHQPICIDRYAYLERLAIMLESMGDDRPEAGSLEHNNLVSAATESGYNTIFARVSTAAARGDWEPAKALCRRERERFGEEWAKDLMREIQALVRETEAMYGGE